MQLASILSSLRNTVIAGIVLAVLLFIHYYQASGYSNDQFLLFLVRWIHVIAGIMWIGLLWYFNFVQIPSMPKIPDEQKPAISGTIAPTALFWFRWAAMATIVFGLLLAHMQGYLIWALTLGFMEPVSYNELLIGIGMWLAIIMWFNVWFVIWPNQKKVLGIVPVDSDAKAAATRTAMLFSRANTMLSVPMLFAMVGAQNL